jgi:RNA methyltransferase, TrmH family
MAIKQIQSRDNPFYKQLKKLAESGRERRKAGNTLLDGAHLIQAFEQIFGGVEALVLSESCHQRAPNNPEVNALIKGREIIVLSDVLMRELGLVESPSGILAVVPMPRLSKKPILNENVVLLDGVQDPGNLGTLMRTAAAAGVKQVLLSPGCASAWSPKVLRAGQGAHFLLSIFEEADLVAFLAAYQGTSLVTCLQGAESLYTAQWSGPLAWIFGSEGQGVGAELIAMAELRIKIPMPGAVESLNVSAAAAICMFEALRRTM